MKNPITIEAVVSAPIEKVWACWNEPIHITRWAFASDDWEAPAAENDLRVGGKFKTVMAAKDKSAGFDFTGTYTNIELHTVIEYDMDDGRHVKTEFFETSEGVKIISTFDPENENPEEVQREGWQAILNNFKKYTEHA
jgi:uncharacterized protein YndB with AHSA1/START domain